MTHDQTPLAGAWSMNLVETVLAIVLISVVVGGIIGWCVFLGKAL